MLRKFVKKNKFTESSPVQLSQSVYCMYHTLIDRTCTDRKEAGGEFVSRLCIVLLFLSSVGCVCVMCCDIKTKKERIKKNKKKRKKEIRNPSERMWLVGAGCMYGKYGTG